MFDNQQPRRVSGADYGAQPAPQQPPQRQPAGTVSQQFDQLISDVQQPRQAMGANKLGRNEVWLSRAYQAHDLDVQRIKFREPTGKEYRQFGIPVRYVTSDSGGVVAETSVVVNIDIVGNYIVVLSDPPVPSSTVDRMSVDDINACSRVICDFFT